MGGCGAPAKCSSSASANFQRILCKPGRADTLIPTMAKNAPSMSMPCDEPQNVSPGVQMRESEFQGWAKFGAIQGHDGSTEVGRAKGNRVAQGMLPPRQELPGSGVSPLGRITYRKE